jgi:MinD-like ATPase involved in chromosome partitioning or flagellar assembly
MTSPRLALLIGTHERVQALLPALQRSRFAVSHHFLDAAELLESVERNVVDLALVSTGPRGVDQTVIAALARNHLPLVVLDSQPHHPRWAGFAGVVLLPFASADVVVAGLEAAVRGDRLRQPVEPPIDRDGAAVSTAAPATVVAAQPAPLSDAPLAAPQVFTVASGYGAPGRSTVAGNLAFLLGQVAPTVLLDADLAAPIQAVYFHANTGKNMGTLAHARPTEPAEWQSSLARDLQRLNAESPQGWLLAGLPRPELRARVDAPFLDDLLSALRARFRYVVIDTGAQWLEGDLVVAVPIQRADRILLVATPDLSSTHRARRALDVVERQVDAETVSVVLNQHRSHRDYDRSEIEFALGYPLSAVLPFDHAACWRSREERRPLVLQARSPLGRGLVEFAERIHGGRVELPRPVHARPPSLASRVPASLRALAARVPTSGGRP